MKEFDDLKNVDRLYFEKIKIRSVFQKEDKSSGLSFIESERDIPFQIKHIYMIAESDQDRQRGFCKEEGGWHFLFCPYGCIDVVVDTGDVRKTITLSNPYTGLLLNAGLWREINWKEHDSVLCLVTSEQYDNRKLSHGYDEYQQFLRDRNQF